MTRGRELMDKKEANDLLKKYLRGEVTKEEAATVERWYVDRANRSEPFPLRDASASKIAMWEVIRAHQRKAKLVRLRRTAYVAAAVLALVSIGGWLVTRERMPDDVSVTARRDTILPGTNRATLTLADGRTIDLSTDQHSIVIGAHDVSYPGEGGEIADLPPGEVHTLALTTPKGGTYTVTLPDGSRVWLNAGSRLTYPSRFSGSARNVEVSGEAYFTVVRDDRRPFRVRSRGQEVEVLGTAFNVSAYDDEAEIRTTLVSGSVKVMNLQVEAARIIRPGQQSIVSDSITSVREVDVEKATAWHMGYFRFDGDMRSILTQVARWYDIEVVFEPGFGGTMEWEGRLSRDRSLETILKALQEADKDITFELTGRRLTVSK